MLNSLENALNIHLKCNSSIALIDGCTGETLSYFELAQAIEKLSCFLRTQGVAPGDVVSVCSPNSIDFVVLVYGIILYGGIANPLNIGWSNAEICKVVDHAEPKLIFCDQNFHLPGYESRLHSLDFYRSYPSPLEPDPLRSINGSSGAILFYTSGTTGTPKGVLLSRDNLLHNLKTAKDSLPLQKHHTAMAILPLYHVHGFVSDLSLMLFCGGTTVILPVFDLEGLENIETVVKQYNVNSFSVVPFILEMMDQFQVNLHSPMLSFCVSGAAPLKVELIENYQRSYDIQVIPAYGMTECMNYCTISPLDRIKPNSIGKPVGIEVRIVNEKGKRLGANQIGELIIKGKSVMANGYYKLQSDCYLDEEMLWFRTGDLGCYDEEGYFFIKGRKTNMVIRGGTKVYLNDLDLCLSEHPKIKESACIRVTRNDQDLIVAHVVKESDCAFEVEDVFEYMEQFVSKDKLPDFVYFRSSIPKTATNKIKIGELQNNTLEKL